MAQLLPAVSYHTERDLTWLPAQTGPSPKHSSDACLESYLHQISGIPLLTPHEERRLARRAARGDAEAQRRLVLSNLRLVVRIASRYSGYGLPLCDLIQEGTLGLIRAAERFDWRRGTRFSTYATYWIREAIIKALTSDGRAAKLSSHAFKRYRKLAKKADALLNEILREPTLPEIAAAMDTSTATVSRILAAAAFSRSLDEPLDGEGRSTPRDELACTCPCDPAELIQDGPTSEQVREAIDTVLNARERWVIVQSFGLEGQVPRKLREMAGALGVSIERVRQIRDRALSKLRAHFRS